MLENGWDKEIAGKAVKEIVKDFQYTFVQPGEDIERNLDKLVKSIATKFGEGLHACTTQYSCLYKHVLKVILELFMYIGLP